MRFGSHYFLMQMMVQATLALKNFEIFSGSGLKDASSSLSSADEECSFPRHAYPQTSRDICDKNS
jgi:hypothetical protein